jgi:hypothetical protein
MILNKICVFVLLFIVLATCMVSASQDEMEYDEIQRSTGLTFLNKPYQQMERLLARDMHALGNAGLYTLIAGAGTGTLAIIFSSILPHVAGIVTPSGVSAFQVLGGLSLGFGIVGSIGFFTGIVLSAIGYGLLTRTMKLSIMRTAYTGNGIPLKKMSDEQFDYHGYAKKMRTLGFVGLGGLVSGLVSSSVGIALGFTLTFNSSLFIAVMNEVITACVLLGGIGGVLFSTGIILLIYGFGFVSRYINYKKRQPKLSYFVDPETLSTGMALSIKL